MDKSKRDTPLNGQERCHCAERGRLAISLVKLQGSRPGCSRRGPGRKRKIALLTLLTHKPAQATAQRNQGISLFQRAGLPAKIPVLYAAGKSQRHRCYSMQGMPEVDLRSPPGTSATRGSAMERIQRVRDEGNAASSPHRHHSSFHLSTSPLENVYPCLHPGSRSFPSTPE